MNFSPIRIEVTVAAPPAKAWTFWTSPEHITQWNFASADWRCPRASNDLRVGGKYFARMEAKDGSFGFDFEAVYDEVVPEKKLVYTMGDGRKATTTFAPAGEGKGAGTRVVTVFDADKENPEEMQRDGWQAILNNFQRHVEREAR